MFILDAEAGEQKYENIEQYSAHAHKLNLACLRSRVARRDLDLYTAPTGVFTVTSRH